jgi:hypothetical protein
MKDQLSALIDGELDIESSEHLITSAKSGGEIQNLMGYLSFDWRCYAWETRHYVKILRAV